MAKDLRRAGDNSDRLYPDKQVFNMLASNVDEMYVNAREWCDGTAPFTVSKNSITQAGQQGAANMLSAFESLVRGSKGGLRSDLLRLSKDIRDFCQVPGVTLTPSEASVLERPQGSPKCYPYLMS